MNMPSDNTPTNSQEDPRVELSMSPLYMSDLLVGIEVACEKDPTFAGCLKRLTLAIRASGYTRETLEEAATNQMMDRLGTDFEITDEEEDEE